MRFIVVRPVLFTAVRCNPTIWTFELYVRRRLRRFSRRFPGLGIVWRDWCSCLLMYWMRTVCMLLRERRSLAYFWDGRSGKRVEKVIGAQDPLRVSAVVSKVMWQLIVTLK